MSDTTWYFGYGSNMSRTIFFEHRKMDPLTTRIARLDGYRLCFNIPVGPGERGVGNIEVAPGAHTWGLLHLLSAADFARLDLSEGVPAGFYQRVAVSVLADGAEPLTAITYQSSLITDGRKPSARYMNLLLEGARAHGLPDDYIAQLEAVELARDERPGHPQPPER